MLSQNAFGNLGIYRLALVRRVGGFRSGYNGQYDYELVLRCASATLAQRIRHIPRVLYHHRDNNSETAIDQSWTAGQRVLEEYLLRSGIYAIVKRAGSRGYQMEYPLPSPLPRVSILVPTTGNIKHLEPCLRSLLTLTSYENFEVLLLINEQNNNAHDLNSELSNWLATQPRVRTLFYSERPFNYSVVNNWGETQASGELLCFLNDDTAVITSDWLERMVARVLLPGVAAVGPMLLYPNDTIQHAGVILGLSGVAGHACHGLRRESSGNHGRAILEQDVSCLTAACLLIRRSVFREVGGFAEDLPVTFNDVDLCMRVTGAGWRMIWTPTVELYHHESASLGMPYSRERRAEISTAAALMRRRWGARLDDDPYYNPNLSLRRAFELSFPPRQRYTPFSHHKRNS
jgi:GT2 family glycosyltransferase